MLTLKSGDVTRAAGLLRDAAARQPADPQIQVHLATVLIEQKRLAEAQKILEAVVASDTKAASAQDAQKLLDAIRKPAP